MNSIALNFDYYSNHRMVCKITDDAQEVSDFFKQQELTKRIYKSHMQHHSLSYIWDDFVKNWYVFYIMRDGRDAITSLWRFYQKRNRFKGTVGEFMRSAPPAEESAYKEAIRKPKTVLQMWTYHIESWIGFPKNQVFYVHFEHLLGGFEKVIKAVGEFIDLKPYQNIQKPSRSDNVIMPGPGIAGSYKKCFTVHDESYFYDNAVYQTDMIKFFDWEALRYHA